MISDFGSNRSISFDNQRLQQCLQICNFIETSCFIICSETNKNHLESELSAKFFLPYFTQTNRWNLYLFCLKRFHYSPTFNNVPKMEQLNKWTLWATPENDVNRSCFR